MTTAQLLYLCGSLLALLIGLLAYLGKKLIAQVENAHTSIATLTASLHTNSEETKKLRTELSVLLKSFHAFDRWIYGEAQHGTFKNPPPDFSAGGSL